MAEGLAAVGVVASIIQLIDFSTKVILRLKEFHSLARELPTSLRHVSAELPILSTTLESICQNLKANPVDSKLETALLLVVGECHEQIAQLDAIIAKTLPTADDKWLSKSKKAIGSLQREDKVENTTKILRNYIATLTFYHTAISSTIQPLKDAKLVRIREWLDAPDPSTNYQKALKQRQEDTGLWFLEGGQYAEWKESIASFLWLHGIPGCGKTILSSAILQNILQHCEGDPGKVTTYFFFDFNDIKKQNPELMVRSLICQLSQQCVTIPASLDTLFFSCNNGQRQPSLHTLLEVLQHMMQEFPCVYIVLDALDECSGREELMDILETMAAWQLESSHMLLTSRKERDIQSSLEMFINEQSNICLQSELVDKDIQKYVQQRLYNDKRLSRWGKDSALRQDIETTLMKGAQGMFRWAVCQLDTLAECRTRAALRTALTTLPPTLDKTYDRILSAISEDDSQYAIPILRWLTFAVRPLSVDEVAEVVAVNLDHEGRFRFDPDGVLEDPLDVLNICPSMVTITTENSGRQYPGKQMVALAHYSVKEYLTSDRIQKGSAARYSMQHAVCHDTIARSCLGYLLQFQGDRMLSQDTIKEFCLAYYSARFWIEHVQNMKEQAEWCSQEAILLLSEKSDAYVNWLRIYDPDKSWEYPNFQRSPQSIPLPLYYASRFGLKQVVELLLRKGADINAQGGEYGNALQAASKEGHEQIVKTLLDAGAEVNAQGGDDGNALQAASVQGHEQVVQMLLDASADVNAQGGRFFSNALQAASYRGYEPVVKMLLDAGAEVNAQAGDDGDALQAASREGHEQIVKMLLDSGAKVNAQGGYNGNALYIASCRGHEQVVKILLDAGAEVNAQDREYGNALQAASKEGHEQIVKILLDAGAEVNAQGRYDSNALYMASREGHKQVVKTLLDAGADINAQGGEYGNALQVASYGGREQVVKILLDAGAEVNAQGGEHGDALYIASYGGREQVVKMLLDAGADVNSRGGEYGNALQAASRWGYEQVVEMLLDAGAEVNAQAGDDGGALYIASYGGYEQVVEILLDAGADVNSRGGEYGNALQAASRWGRKQIVEILLDAGADVNSRGGKYGNALQAASRWGHEQVVEILLDAGAEVNAQDEGKSSALQAASYRGYEQIVEMLLDAGAEVNAQAGGDGSALQAASRWGHEQIIEMLLDAGADVNAQDKDKSSALQAASAQGHEQVVQMLLDASADVNAQGGRFFSNALQAASYRGHKQVVKILLDAGAEVNAQGGEYGNALQAASKEGHEQVVKMLLDRGAKVNAQDSQEEIQSNGTDDDENSPSQA